MAVSDISLTSGMRSNLLSLQGTVDLLNRTQERLSTGKKVNTAIDNPTSYFASQSLTSRANLIDSMKDAMGQAVQTITAADKGITSITSMIEQAKGIAESALSAEQSTGAVTGEINLSGLTAQEGTGIDTGTIILTGIDGGWEYGKLTITADGDFAAGETITLGTVVFTATTGATDGASRLVDISGGTKQLDAAELAKAINDYDWSAEAATFIATDNTDGSVSISKIINGGNETDFEAADVDISSTTGVLSAAPAAALQDTIIIGGVTFTATTGAPGADEFLDTGNDEQDMRNLSNAINNHTWGGTYRYEADIDANGNITLSKYVNATGGAVSIENVAGDFNVGGGTSHPSEADITIVSGLTGNADQINIGGVGGLTFTAVSANPGADEVLASGNDEIDLLSLKDAINNADWSTKDYAFSAEIKDGALSLSKTVTAQGITNDVDGLATAGAVAGDTADVVDGDMTFAKGTGNTSTMDKETVEGDSELSNLVTQFNEMRTQIDKLAEDAGYKGKNLLYGATEAERTLTVKFEGSSLDVVGFDATTTGLSITAADSNETKWTSAGTAGTTAINASIDKLNAALDTLRQKSSALAGNLSIITVRQDFSTNMINTLTEGADKLTLADTNEEGANMLMLQTRQSLSTTALSLAAQAAQSVLKLFG